MSGGQPIPSQKLSQAFALAAVSESIPNTSNPGYKTAPFPIASQIGTTPAAASMTDGFPPLTMESTSTSGIPPFGQDFNGILFHITANLAPLVAGQLMPFDSTLSAAMGGYAVGAVLSDVGGNLWWNSIAGNTEAPLSGGITAPDGWLPLYYPGTTALNLTGEAGTIVLSDAAAAPAIIILTGTLTNDVTLAFPVWKRTWLILNETSGAHNVYAETINGNGVLIRQSTVEIVGDGNFVYQTLPDFLFLQQVYAPFISPALTGTPTAPTPPTGDSSLRIATTAFVNNQIANSIGKISCGVIEAAEGPVNVGTSQVVLFTVSVIPNAYYDFECLLDFVTNAGASTQLECQVLPIPNTGSITLPSNNGISETVNAGGSPAITMVNAANGIVGILGGQQGAVIRGKFITGPTVTGVQFALTMTAGSITVDVGSCFKATLLS